MPGVESLMSGDVTTAEDQAKLRKLAEMCKDGDASKCIECSVGVCKSFMCESARRGALVIFSKAVPQLIDEVVRLRIAMGADQNWPLADVLEKLADVAKHLLHDHNCDSHGHEEARAAGIKAREYALAVRTALAKGRS